MAAPGRPTERQRPDDGGDDETHPDSEPVAPASPETLRGRVRLLSVGFFLVFVAFSAGQLLQTVINGGSGYLCLALIYVPFALMAVGAPSLVGRFGPTRLLPLAASGYALFVASNILGDPAFLLPGCTVVGLCAAVLWASQGTFLGTAALAMSVASGRPMSACASDLNATFFSIFMASGGVSSVLASVIILAAAGKGGEGAGGADGGGPDPSLALAVRLLFVLLTAAGCAGVAVLAALPEPDAPGNTVVDLGRLRSACGPLLCCGGRGGRAGVGTAVRRSGSKSLSGGAARGSSSSGGGGLAQSDSLAGGGGSSSAAAASLSAAKEWDDGVAAHVALELRRSADAAEREGKDWSPGRGSRAAAAGRGGGAAGGNMGASAATASVDSWEDSSSGGMAGAKAPESVASSSSSSSSSFSSAAAADTLPSAPVPLSPPPTVMAMVRFLLTQHRFHLMAPAIMFSGAGQGYILGAWMAGVVGKGPGMGPGWVGFVGAVYSFVCAGGILAWRRVAARPGYGRSYAFAVTCVVQLAWFAAMAAWLAYSKAGKQEDERGVPLPPPVSPALTTAASFVSILVYASVDTVWNGFIPATLQTFFPGRSDTPCAMAAIRVCYSIGFSVQQAVSISLGPSSLPEQALLLLGFLAASGALLLHMHRSVMSLDGVDRKAAATTTSLHALQSRSQSQERAQPLEATPAPDNGDDSFLTAVADSSSSSSSSAESKAIGEWR